VKKVEFELPRELRPKPEYRKYVSGVAYEHKQNNPIERGEASLYKEETYAKFYKRTDLLSSLKVNGFDTDDITMPYEFDHCKLVYDDNDVQVTFDFEEIQFSEKETSVESITSPESGKDAARLKNTISTKYIGYSQDVSESVILLVDKKRVEITWEGFVEDECYEVITDSKSGAHFLYRIIKDDGTREEFKADPSVDREAKLGDPFTRIEPNNTQSTGSVTMTETSSANKSMTVNDFDINYKLRAYDVYAPVTLASSTQKNLLQTKEGEEWTAKFRNHTYTIPKSKYTVSNDKGSVTGGSESNGYKIYDYKNTFTYTRGTNTQTFVPKGVIKVEVEEDTFFPKKWGRLLRAKQTVANNPSHNGYVYTWLLEFENNVKLPVPVAPGSVTPDWDFSYAETTTVSDYNGGTYDKATGKWICTTASDKPNQMIWSRNSREKANKDYQIARNQHWDEDHTVDGHPSTQTSRYDLQVSSDGRLTAKDTYKNRNMGNWK
jgi:hypothetical protein